MLVQNRALEKENKNKTVQPCSFQQFLYKSEGISFSLSVFHLLLSVKIHQPLSSSWFVWESFTHKKKTLLCKCIPLGLKDSHRIDNNIFPRPLIRQKIAPLASVNLLSLSLIWKDSLLWNVAQKKKNPLHSRPLVRRMQPKERIWRDLWRVALCVRMLKWLPSVWFGPKHETRRCPC